MQFSECFLFVYFIITTTNGSDITNRVFGSLSDILPAAFGDFNSDELTDVFVLRNNQKTVEILLGNEEEPLLRTGSPPLMCKFENSITSVVPGDFDGDALMDVLVTTAARRDENDDTKHKPHTYVHIIWGGGNYINCSNETTPFLTLIGQPLAMDYNQDMTIDLFGTDAEGQRKFWIFNNMRISPVGTPMQPGPVTELQLPHAHAFLDLNKDFMADLFISTKENFEVWYGNEDLYFVYKETIPHPKDYVHIGQSIFMDVELQGRMDLITPVCYDKGCHNSSFLVYSDEHWYNLQVNFKDPNNNQWGFARRLGKKYTNTITLHSGDFNMDGYPDILATLELGPDTPSQSFLLENVPCESGCEHFKRNFKIRWNALHPFKEGTVMAVFFDFYQDGILDVILVHHNGSDYKTAAFKNSLDYDANFIKLMVLTGLTNKDNKLIDGRVGKKRRTYGFFLSSGAIIPDTWFFDVDVRADSLVTRSERLGTNLPGPSISYRTTTQEGNSRHASSSQLPQSAHFSLNLPYTIFGLGRTPNFVDTLKVGLSNYSKEWFQIIPNSQMVVIPWPPKEPSKWKAQLFVTPSKVILTSVAALTGVCGLITIIIGVLHWKERQEDKKERLQESHRFHFDAM